jgi:hypothetical protein
MNPNEAVDWTIRNQRHRGWAPWLWLGAWALVWAAGGMFLVRLTWWEVHWALVMCWLVPTLGSFAGLMVYLDQQPVKRLKLGDELRAYPMRRMEPKDIRAIHFGPDPDEDYAEGKLPFPVCQVTVEGRRRKLRLVTSAGEAARLREWAERKGIAVIDPEGFATRGVRDEPS